MDRSPTLFLIGVSLVLFVTCFCGVGTVAAEDGEMPGEPASFYGTATETDGTAVPAGTRIVAVVNGEVESEITVETAGEYGESGAFDDKLRVDSSAGEEVTFRLLGPSGPTGGTKTLESGISEENLTFEDGSVASLAPDPAIDIAPNVSSPGDPVAFSAAESTAHPDTGLVTFEWSIERDNETIETFDGKERNRTFEEIGEYETVLTVTDAGGRIENETSGFEIEADDADTTTNSSETSDSGSTGESSGGGGSGGSTSTSGSSGSDGSDGSVGGGSSSTSSSGGGGGGSTSGGETGGSGSAGGSGTSSSSGGSESTRDPGVTEIKNIEDQFPGTSGTTVVFGETMIREIEFENSSTGGEVSIEEFEEPPGDVPALPEGREVASASVITVPEEYLETDAVLRATVSEEWLDEQGISPEYLTVYRLPDGGEKWEALPTETSVIDGGYAVVAYTPGFSQFVIAGREPPSEGSDGQEPIDDETKRETDAQSAGTEPGTGGESVEPTEPEGPIESTGFDPASPLVPLAALCALLIVVAAIGRLFIPRRRDDW